MPDKNTFKGSWIAAMSELVKQYGGINLAQGIPGFAPPLALLDQLRLVSHESIHQYPKAAGVPGLINIIQTKYRDSTTLSPNEIMVVQGATEGITLFYTYLVNRFGLNWTALAFDPVYESYRHLPRIFGNQLKRLNFTPDLDIDWTVFEKEIIKNKVKLFFLNSPGNPLPRIWSQDEIQKVISLAEKYQFYVLFDAVYMDLVFGNTDDSLDMRITHPNLVYVNSFSKMLSVTGWRVGYIIANHEMMADLHQVHDYTGLCANSVAQEAISRYMQENELGIHYINHLREQLSHSCELLSTSLRDLGFLFHEVDAGYFIWAELPPQFTDSIDFSLNLFKTQKVSVVPGSHFDPKANRTVRFNFARPESEIQQAIQRISAYLNC